MKRLEASRFSARSKTVLALGGVIALASCGDSTSSSDPTEGAMTAVRGVGYTVKTDAGSCNVTFDVPGSSSCTLNLWPAPVIPPAAAPPAGTMVPTPACGYNVAGVWVAGWLPCPLCPPIAPVCTNFAPTNGVADTCTCTSALAPPGGGFTGPSGVQTEIGDTGWFLDVGVSCKGFTDQVWTCPPPSKVAGVVATVPNAPFGPSPQTANLTPSVNACSNWLGSAQSDIQQENNIIAQSTCQSRCPGGTLDSLGPDPQTNPNPYFTVTPGGAGGCTASLTMNLNSLYRCHN